MPRPSEREIEESYDRVYGTPDDADEALLRHVMLDDERPPQGLHQCGWQRPTERWEDEAVDDYRWPGLDRDDYVYGEDYI